jgi:hypothetical protein
LENIPLLVEEIQPRITPTVAPTLPTRIVNPTMKSNNRTIPGKKKPACTMRLAMGMQPYDILNNLDHIQPTISMRQLLVVSPKY